MQPIRILGRLLIIAVCCAMCGVERSKAADESKSPAKTKPRANRLKSETSPYLLLHAHNPVDWYPWGPEAFEKAKKENKLIFLSVGYSSCYWCHVMERKVFSDEAIAKSMNDNFICIKVDREERPDVDDIYMTALQVYFSAIGSPSGGGWPLSIFLTPDGKPVAGGTYFPPEDTDGMQGFPTILAKLIDLWKNNHDEMVGNANILTKETRRLMRPKMSPKPVEINDGLIESVYAATVSGFDPEFGGLDFNPSQAKSPKFPTPAKLAFVQQLVERHADEEVGRLLDMTLMQIACGGIRDHVGGGFHRYSVDRRWDVPHFEKMLYDQAQLADVYIRAYSTTKRPLYKQVAEEIFAFVNRELTAPDGGFYSALDAETNGVEGEYYVWDATEIDNILGSGAGRFKDLYRVKDLPDFEHGNVLRLVTRRLPKPADADSLDASEGKSERDEFTLSRQKLLDVRSKRKAPLRDDKILTAWNGLMISAYARASQDLNHPEYAKSAERAASFVLAKMRDPQGRLLHSYAKGKAKLNAFLDDYAFMVDGLLALHDVTNDQKWLKAAKQLQDDQLRLFLDETNGGFFFTSHEHEELLARTKNCYDGVLPAGNSVSARNLIRLAKRTGTSDYRDEARAAIELFASGIEQAPRGHANLALAAIELLEAENVSVAANEQKEIVPAAGKDDKAQANEPLVLLAGQTDERPKKDEHVKARAYLSTDKLPAGSTCQFVILLNIDEKWHINQNPPDPENLIPVKVSFKSKLGVTSSAPKYPKGHSFKFKGDEDNPVMAYEGEVAIFGTLTIPDKLAGQMDEMDIVIDYQACNEEGVCLPPKKIKLSAKLGVTNKGEAPKSINARLFTATTKPTAKNPDK